MAKVSVIQNSFNAGELSPRLKARIDLQAKYTNGCEILENFLPTIQGPAKKRPGTRFVNEVKNSANNVRLFPFQYSIEQAYVLEFGDTYIRFYKDGGVILSGGLPYEIVSPYAHTDLSGIQFAQSADVMYLAHPDYPPYKLSRTGHTSWSLDIVDFDWYPFNDTNVVSAITVTSSALTGTGITLTASGSFFTSGDVGRYIRFEEVVASKYKRWTAGEAVTSGDFRQYEGNVYQAATTATTGVTPPIHTEGTESDDTVNWLYLHSGFGYAEITAYTSTTVVTADVIKTLPNFTTSGTKKWAWSAWSALDGYPKTVGFYEDRLWFAGSYARPQTLWASVSGDYENHQYGTKDDDALNYTINSQEVNTIQWISPGKVMIVGTSGGEFIVSASTLNEAITPSNVKIAPNTTYGSSAKSPLRIGNVSLFIQRSGKKIREFVYNFEQDSYVAPNMLILADHLTEDSSIKEFAYQQEPDQLVWVCLNDGTLCAMTYERTEDVLGWHRHPMTNGSVESLTAIPHWDGDGDSVWLVVNRTVNGNTVRYIEYIEKYLMGDDSFYVDSGLSYNGSATTTITGLDHLEGETVNVLTDGAVHPSRTVVSGSITLQQESSVVNIGLPITAKIRTMPIEAGARDGIAQGKTMRIDEVVFRLLNAGAGFYYGVYDVETLSADLDELQFRTTIDLMGEPIPLFTGDTDILSMPGGYQSPVQVEINHILPLPCTVVAIMAQLSTYDR